MLHHHAKKPYRFFVNGDCFSLTCSACGAELNLEDCYGDGTAECVECGEDTSIADAILSTGGTFEQFNYTLSSFGILTEAAWDEDNEDEEDWDDEDESIILTHHPREFPTGGVFCCDLFSSLL